MLALQQAAHATVHILVAELAGLGLTSSEINAMANLASGEGSKVSDLAVAAGVRATTMTGVLDRLEQRGLVTRQGAPWDRRAVLVELTPSGRSAARTIRQAISRLEDRVLAGLPASTIAGLQAGLRALAGLTP